MFDGKHSLRAILLAVIVSFITQPAWSSGYFIDQQSVPGLGRADAGDVAAANDPSTVFFNPAGITELFVGADPPDIRRESAGMVLIIPSSDLNNTRSTISSPGSLGFNVPVSGPNQSNPAHPDPAPVGSFYAVQRFPGYDRWFFGFGMNTPFGLGAHYDHDWFGRYDSTEVSLFTLNFSPVVAYKLSDRISIGAGVDVQHADALLAAAIPNPLAPGGPSADTDSRSRITGDSWGVGYHVGLLYKVTQALRLGVNYRSELDQEITGDATFYGFKNAPIGPNGTFLLPPISTTVDASTELDLPAIFSAGAVYDLNRYWTIFGDYTWYGWSVAKEARIRFGDGIPDAVRPEHFHDTFTAALGFERHVNDNLILRGGVKFDETPTNDAFRDTTFADANRVWLAIGATYRISNSLIADFAFAHVLEEGTSIHVVRTFFEDTPLETKTTIVGDVHSFVDTVGVNFRYKF
jgi:long-chain fatty acid transport protein